MGKVTLVLDTRREKGSGRFPLKFGVSFGGQYAYFSTGIDIEQRQWNGRDIVKCENKAAFNQLILFKRLELEKAMLGLECRGITAARSADEMKGLIERQISGRFQASSYKVRDGFEAKILQVPKEKTREIYRATLEKIGAYYNLDTLVMSDIDYRWLCDFERRLRERNNKVNTISVDMRNIRAVFNHLINLGDIELESYPFRKYKVKSEETRKRSLKVEQLRKIRDHEDGPMRRYADIFMLIFYLRGINVIDLCGLKEITPDGRIEYRRSKTGKLYSIKVEPEAMEIIDRYRGTQHLIDILDRRKEKRAHRSFTSRMNKYLKTMIPGISTYWARHAWATTAAELDIPHETIAAALGHNYGSKVTGIYIDFNEQKVDEANRKVIDYLNGYSLQ